MRNLFALLGLLVVLFAGLGWFRGWYTFESEPTPTGHRRINVDLDTRRITTDVETGEKKVQQIVAKVQQSASTTVQPTPDSPVAAYGDAQPRQVSATPTGLSGPKIQLNPDGTVSGSFTLPPLVLPDAPR